MVGTRIGAYEITASLGEGGMGEVFRARDTKLNRDVAIKMVRTAFTGDPDRRARFTREAHILASLNHPNIAHVYGLEETADGVPAIIMELVDGPTLADRLVQGAIAWDEARPIIEQIVMALEAAHEQGIVHRDLKPANIKVRPDGTVKVLDFGLAKAMDAGAAGPQDIMNSPTITNRATQLGVVLGTAAYMAPEQAKGRPIDKRADIWSFGVVVYEMLTGRLAFDAEDVSETLAAVLTRNVDIAAMPADAPPSVRALVAECLVRDPKQRLRDIGDARLILTRAAGGALAPAPGLRSQKLPWFFAGIFAAAAIVVWLIRAPTPPAADSPAHRLALPVPTETTRITVSPDGQVLLYRPANVLENAKMRRLTSASLEWQDLAGTAGGTGHFWSPDSRRVGFGQGNALKIIDLVGSKPLTLCTCIVGNFRGGTWNRDGLIVFSDTLKPLRRIQDTGGEASAVFEMDASRQETEHLYPVFLPDGRRFFFVARSKTGNHFIMLGSIDGGRTKPIASSYSSPAFASEHLLFVRDGALLAQPFDQDKEEVVGDPVVIEKNVLLSSGGIANFSVSGEGTLVSGPESLEEYWWVDRAGAPIEKLEFPPRASQGRISPDGARLAAQFIDSDIGSSDIYVSNRKGGGWSRLTFDPEWDLYPVWSPTGAQVMYRSQRQSPKSALFVRNSEGPEPDRFLIAKESNLIPADWSPDGRHVLIAERPTGKSSDIMTLSMPEGSRLEPWLATEFQEDNPRFSPDGAWVAFDSNESGSVQVYVRKFSDSRVGIRVTASGGTRPIWSHDGKALYYRNVERRLMMVTIRMSPDVSAGTPQEFFPPASGFEIGALAYEVDNQGRFLIGLRDRTSRTDSASIVFNWPALLKR